MNKKVLSLIGLAFIGCSMYAQEKKQDSANVNQLETLYLDSKTTKTREKSGKVIYKITQEDLKSVQGQSLAQTINTVSGIEITGSKSVQGQNLSYRVRGGNNNQVVFLIDGVQISDPSSINSDFDLRLIDESQIESIEIIKGGVSTLYGTGATTAVISITTLKEHNKKISSTINMDAGSNRTADNDEYNPNTANLNGNISGKLGKFSYLVSGNIENTKGISAAKSSDKNSNFEDDAFVHQNGLLKFGYEFNNKFTFNTFANFNRFETDYDGGAGFDAENESVSENTQIGITPEYKHNKGKISLNAAYNQNNRDFFGNTPSKYDSQTFVGDLFSNYKITNNFELVLGLNAQEQKMDQATTPFGGNSIVEDINSKNAKVTLIDPYINAVYNFDFGLNINAGGRINNHSNYGSHIVYNINPSYLLNINSNLTSKFLGSFSTSFIAPSLYQQYDPIYGNDKLEAQESKNGELGLELNYNKKYRFSIVGFHREDENLIDFVSVFDNLGNYLSGGYQNISNNAIKTQGLELETILPLFKNVNIKGNYTFIQHETDNLSRKVPKHKVNANLVYNLKQNTSFNLAYQFTDKRLEGVYNPSTFLVDNVTLKAYTLVNIFINHNLTKNLSINASLFNLFNEDYLEQTGYSTRGRNYKVGLRLSL